MILQISRIQNRRGLQENLPPQLASGELGWSIDERRLFIGNGTAEEGAPELGNTEILTVHSSVLSLDNTYTFKGLAAGYEVQTGTTLSGQISRSMQDKFDDIVNVRDFGATGQGIFDDSHAINWAITQLYKKTVVKDQPLVRRTLYFPAGTYKLTSETIQLLPYVKLKGDGKNSTFIIQSGTTAKPVIESSPVYGASTSIILLAAGNSEVSGMTLINETEADVITLDSFTDILFERVKFQGPTGFTPDGLTQNSCVKVGAGSTGSVTLSSQLLFSNCEFSGRNYALYCDNNLTNTNIVGGSFTNLYRGINLGQAYVGVANISSIKISYSIFDNIINNAIFTASSAAISNIVSAFNTYKSVSNTPGTAVLNLAGNNCYSIGDMFDRLSTAATPAVDLHGTASFATLSNGRILLGRQLSVGGTAETLSPTVVETLAGIVGYGLKSTTVEYSITRDTDQRVGTLKIANTGSDIVYDDEYVETADIGIILTPSLNTATGVIELMYTLGVGNDATLTTTSRTLT